MYELAFRPGINLIVGLPASGKTVFAMTHAPKGYKVIHTDDYKYLGWKNAATSIADDIIGSDNKNIIVEGVLAFRLLRKEHIRPSCIIMVQTDDRKRKARYEGRGSEGDYKAMDKQLIGLWQGFIDEYYDLKITRIVIVNT